MCLAAALQKKRKLRESLPANVYDSPAEASDAELPQPAPTAVFDHGAYTSVVTVAPLRMHSDRYTIPGLTAIAFAHAVCALAVLHVMSKKLSQLNQLHQQPLTMGRTPVWSVSPRCACTVTGGPLLVSTATAMLLHYPSTAES